jgi:hypothetical protein
MKMDRCGQLGSTVGLRGQLLTFAACLTTANFDNFRTLIQVAELQIRGAVLNRFTRQVPDYACRVVKPATNSVSSAFV